MGEDTCARAKVLAKREARNLPRVLVAPHFCSQLAATLMLFCSRLPPVFPPLNTSSPF